MYAYGATPSFLTSPPARCRDSQVLSKIEGDAYLGLELGSDPDSLALDLLLASTARDVELLKARRDRQVALTKLVVAASALALRLVEARFPLGVARVPVLAAHRLEVGAHVARPLGAVVHVLLGDLQPTRRGVRLKVRLERLARPFLWS